MKQYITLFFVFLLLAFSTVRAQNTELLGDSIELVIDGYKTGNIQWQMSTDSIKWNDIAGATNTKLKCPINNNIYFRAKITADKCIYFSSNKLIKAHYYKIRKLTFSHSNDSVQFSWLDPISDDFKGINVINTTDNSNYFIPPGKMSFNYKYDSNLDSLLLLNFKPIFEHSKLNSDTTIKINSYALFFSVNNKFVAHRGYSAYYPENTIMAYEKAAEIGFKYVECDIRLTKDNKWVLLHDETIDRVSNGTGAIASLNYSDLSKVNFGEPKRFNNKYNEPIASYEEFLKTCKALNLYPYIEIKIDLSNAQAQALINLTLQYLPDYNFCFHSFYSYSLQQIRKYNKKIILGFLKVKYEYSDFIITHSLYPSFFNLYFNDEYFFKNTQIDYTKLNEFVSRFSSKNMNTVLWVIDDKTLANKFISCGIKNIITGNTLFK